MFTIDCRRSLDSVSFFRELSSTLDFPAYFGSNWAAVEDCLTDLVWLEEFGSVVLLFDFAELLLAPQQDQLSILLGVLDDVGEHWSKPISEGEDWDRGPIAFHSILVTDDSATMRGLERRGIYAVH